MKNIHVLPTDKPSRLHITSKLDLYPNGVSRKPQGLCKNQHIYITTDEEIKPNTYCLINGVLCKTEIREGKIVSRQLTGGATMDICKSEYLEIILTTDQDLIEDGVQAIDDEFLEWFIQNPTCENIPIIMTTVSKESTYKTNIGFESWRKEVPKQECDANVLTCLNEKCICKSEKIKTGYTASETELIGVQITLKDGSQQFIPKQETLEEAAHRILTEYGIKSIGQSIGVIKVQELMVEMAKWQQEQDSETRYSYDELRRIAYNAYCFGQFEEPTEGKFNQWIVEFKKETT